jgi:uncharacterized membrane protein
MLNSWLHLMSLTAYLGAVAGLLFLLIPSLAAAENVDARLKLLARALKRYNPLQSGALGLMVISGAFQVTDLKAAYRELFVQELGATLGLKLAFAFLLILLSTYQSMAVAHRFVRRYDGGESVSPEELRSVVRQLRSSSLPMLFLAAVTLWTGVRLRG